MSTLRTLGVSAVVLACAIALNSAPAYAGSEFTITHTSITGFTGDQETASVLLDNVGTTNIRGWSFGVCVDPSVASIASAAAGSTTATVNNGGSPDFESLNFFPAGLTHGVVICFSGCSELPPGVGYELLTIDYDLVGSEGDTSQNCFCDSLGVPAIETLVADPVGNAIFPTEVCGDVTILDPPEPVTGLTCTAVELTCTCNITVSWSNPDTYDSINVYRDGVLEATLAGNATFYNSIDEVGLHEFCIEPVRDGLTAAQQCCSANCPDLSVDPTPVSGLNCVADAADCTAVVTWSNTSDYSEITVSLDGGTPVVLSGSATSTIIDLGTPGTHEICVAATTICGDAVSAECCNVDYPVLPTAVTGLMCTVDDATCEATLTWTNTSDYVELTVSVDGGAPTILAGTATSAVISLGGPGVYAICVGGETVCEDVIPDECCSASCVVVAPLFLRGDFNEDGTRNIADPIALLDFLFALGMIVDCEDALDANDDGGIDIGDAVFMLGFLFDEGPEPPAPFDSCGPDPTSDSIDCNEFDGC
ncbi:MAG: hypothetical protein AAF488_13705 [Planctomycetota bacterium]